MATQTYILPGIAYWAKVFEFNRDKTGYNNELAHCGGQTTIDLDVDNDGLAIYMKSKAGGRPRPSPDNDGMMRVKFKRKWEDRYSGGEPDVFTADGQRWDTETMGLIGNGSKVEVMYEVYETSYGNYGTRLSGIRVVDHVPYESDYEPQEKVTFDFQSPAPKPAATKADTKPKSKAKVEDDAIPFL